MKQFILMICILAGCVFVLESCSTLDRLVHGKTPLDQFRHRVDSILSDSIFAATKCGIEIVSLDNGEVLYERDAKTLLRPASNMKLLTTAAALETLGKNYLFRTALYSDSLTSDSVVHGNIYLKGSGDPDFTSAQLAGLVSALKGRNVSRINGNIVGDATYFDDQRWGAGWMWDDEPEGFAAYNSPLTINRNCVEVRVEPGRAIGDTLLVSIEPITRYVSLQNNGTTTADTIVSTLVVTRKYKERLNVVTVAGGFPRRATPEIDHITVWSPEMYFLTLAKEELARQGIAFEGRLVLDTIPHRAFLVSEHLQPIDSVLVFLNKMSDNLSAENVLRVLGVVRYGQPGSSEHGISVVKGFLYSLGIDTTKFSMVDGSGVSYYDLLTPDLLVHLLTGMHARKKSFDLFYETLPNAGVDGLLVTRMRGTSAQNNLHAKTGTLRGASTLTGYVRTADGELLAFSMMMQNYLGSGEPYRKAQDAIGVLMATLRRK